MEPTPSRSYPIVANSSLVDEDQITQYLECLFDRIEWNENRWINIRGIGEKGTRQESTFREDKFYRPIDHGVREAFIAAAHRYAQHEIAFFCVPAVLKAPTGSAANVELFTNLVVDFDSGDTDAKMGWLETHVGPPTMVVNSGGRTEEGKDKIHVYYKLDNPTSDIGLAIRLRDEIARKAGGDKQFGLGVEGNPYGRAHQPVRIAGGCHSKHSKPNPVRIRSLQRDSVYTLEGITQALAAMPFAPWIPAESQLSLPAPTSNGTPSLFDPSRHNGHGGAIEATLTSPIYEGGEDRNRFGEFSKVAGHYVRMARQGMMTSQEALEATQGWTLAQMKPAWPDERVNREFWKIHDLDTARNGRMEPPVTYQAAITPPTATEPVATPPSALAPHPDVPTAPLLSWAAHRWMSGETPQHTFLVDRLLIKGEPHIFVAEGGAGKTGMILDLAMKVAAFAAAKHVGIEFSWCGQKVIGGGRVVLILNEDSKTELHIRSKSLDQQNLIAAAGDNLVVIPTSDTGGSFPLCARDPRTGVVGSSPKWNSVIEAIKAQGPCALVVLDTFNSIMHGEENSSTVVAEMVREARRVCAELGGALIITHHMRKQGNEPIRSLEELKDAVRGSSAIEGAFRIVFGMFKANDYDRRMKAMGLTPQKNALWRFGVAKANIIGMFRGEKTLLRGSNGILEDCTDLDKFNAVNTNERAAWLILSIKLAARNGHPYSNGGKTALSGLFKRRAELPSLLRKVGASEFSILVENSLQDNRLALSARGSKEKKWLDEPGGLIATDDPDAHIDQGAYSPPDFGEYVYVPRDGIVIHKSQHVEPFQNGVPTIPDTVPQALAPAMWSNAMKAVAAEPGHPERRHMKGAVDD